jgi:N-acetylmuramoyl-L-alanine amidase
MKQSISNINKIVIHCSDTPPSMDIGAKEIKVWHVNERGFNDIGYHSVIRRDGTIEKGRDLTTVPAANGKGNNLNSFTICWVGGRKQGTTLPEDNRTPEQKTAMRQLIIEFDNITQKTLQKLGHRDLPGVTKSCPCFDVQTEL